MAANKADSDGELVDPLHHVEINVSDLKRSTIFYGELLAWLGYVKTLDEKNVVGWRKGKTRIFLVQTAERFRSQGYHRKRVGLNHVAFRAASRNVVDEFLRRFLAQKGIPILYGGPKEWPDYEGGYYAVYFEDPDRIKLELVYTP